MKTLLKSSILAFFIINSQLLFSQNLPPAGSIKWENTGTTGWTTINDPSNSFILYEGDLSSVAPSTWESSTPGSYLMFDASTISAPGEYNIEIAYPYYLDLSDGGPFAYFCEQFYVRDSSKTFIKFSTDSIKWTAIEINHNIKERDTAKRLAPFRIPEEFRTQKVWVKLTLNVVKRFAGVPSNAIWIIDDIRFVQLPVVKIKPVNRDTLMDGRINMCFGDSLVIKRQVLNPPIDNTFKVESNWGGDISSEDSLLTIKSGDVFVLGGRSPLPGANTFSSGNTMAGDNDSLRIAWQTPFDEKIFLVTVDTATNRNLIVWRRTTDTGTEKYVVYKETAAGKKQLGNILFEDIPVFIDTTSRPELKPEKYIITTIDSCGNEAFYATANAHVQMRLQTESFVDKILLTWNKYEGFPYDKFFIYRGSTPYNMEYLDEIEVNQTNTIQLYEDTNPLDGANYYRLEVDRGEVLDYRVKANAGPFSRSISNLEDNRLQSAGLNTQTADDIDIYPSPSLGIINIALPTSIQSNVNISIYSISGQKVYEQSNVSAHNKIITINPALPAGTFLLRVNSLHKEYNKIIISQD